MTYRGRVKNGVVVLDEPAELPEGTEVRVDPVADETIPTLAEQFQDIIGIASDLPADLALNHDHYLYGAPKK
jgi:hypothetical protein